jgi:hypothetical protein
VFVLDSGIDSNYSRDPTSVCPEERYENNKSNNPKETTAAACTCDSVSCKVGAEDEAHYAACEVDYHEADTAYCFFHVGSDAQLDDQVEEDVDDASMEEDGEDNAEPLIGYCSGWETTESANVG